MIYIFFFILGIVNTLYLEFTKIVFFGFQWEKNEKNIIKVSLPCHSSRGLWVSGNLWEAV